MNKPDYIGKKEWDILNNKYSNTYIEKKIKENYPVQYLIGNVEFLNTIINVDERVLIPRFETELLVEQTINEIKKMHFSNPRIIDIGTGSGCIAISLAKSLNIKVEALDISNDAIKAAKSNALLNKVDIYFLAQDILTTDLNDTYDVIISNPPYVREEEIVDPQTKYEPQNALFAKDDGLLFYKRIIDLAINYLNNPGLIAFEIGNTQGSAIKKYAKEKLNNPKIIINKDYNNRDRIMFIKVNE